MFIVEECVGPSIPHDLSFQWPIKRFVQQVSPVPAAHRQVENGEEKVSIAAVSDAIVEPNAVMIEL